jgi:hypothetical protein
MFSILGSRADRRLKPLAFAMRATVALESPASRAIFQKGRRARRKVDPVSSYAFAFMAPEPFPDGRGRNAYGAGFRAGNFARLAAAPEN